MLYCRTGIYILGRDLAADQPALSCELGWIRKRFGAFEHQHQEAFQSFVMIAFSVNTVTMSIEGDVGSVVW